MTETHTRMIVGLGNPGRAYAHNRHNVGFRLLDHLAKGWATSFSRVQSHSLVASLKRENQKLILVKPQTMMNLSGQAVGPLVDFYKLALDDVLVAYDDLDLPSGQIRLKPGGGSGGHKGIKSIMVRLGRDEFPRLRLGIGRPPGRMEAADYVLQDLSEGEEAQFELTFARSIGCIKLWLSQGLAAAMTECNQRDEPN